MFINQHVWNLLIILLDRPPCHNDMRIVGQYCSTPYTEAKETIDSDPYLVNISTLYFLFRCPSPGVFLSPPCHSSPPSSYVTAAATSRAPARLISSCYHHRILTCAPGALSDPSHRSISDIVAVYCANIFWRRRTYYSIFKKPAASLAAAAEIYFHVP